MPSLDNDKIRTLPAKRKIIKTIKRLHALLKDRMFLKEDEKRKTVKK
jgi:hypothetical protein